MRDNLKTFTVIFLLTIILWGIYDKENRKKQALKSKKEQVSVTTKKPLSLSGLFIFKLFSVLYDFICDVTRHNVVSQEFHSKSSTSFSHRTKACHVPEHFRKRHNSFDGLV